MTGAETTFTFCCQGQSLVGILHGAPQPSDIGVLIIVGGPQYRLGSHRQFLLLARHVAANGVPVFRFDYRGMGDSGGDMVGFENIDADIRSAIDAFLAASPGLKRIVIWGLCDAASAALFYAHKDPRVAGLVLLNPWVRTDEGVARTYLKHYYVKRLLSRDFWAKIISGEWNAKESVESLLGMVMKLVGREKIAVDSEGAVGSEVENLPERVTEGLKRFTGPVLFILSHPNDYVANEFRDVVARSKRLKSLMALPRVTVQELDGANHTFSRQEWRDTVAEWTLGWITANLVDERN